MFHFSVSSDCFSEKANDSEIATEQRQIITLIQIAMNRDKISDLFETPMGLMKPQSAVFGTYSSSYRIFNHTHTK